MHPINKLNKLKPIKNFLEKRERRHIQGLPKFFGYCLLLVSQNRVNLQTLNFVCTFIESIRTKAHEKFGEKYRSHGRSQGVPKILRTSIWGALCGHLCDSTAFLLFAIIWNDRNSLFEMKCFSSYKRVLDSVTDDQLDVSVYTERKCKTQEYYQVLGCGDATRFATEEPTL